MKAIHDGLSRVWKPERILEPFYKGGKIELTKDQKYFVCEYEGNVKIVDANDPTLITSINNIEDENPDTISTFCIHPNGKELVYANSKFALCHWNIEEKSLIKMIKAHRMPILTMDYEGSGTLVATGSADRSVKVWDIVKGYCTHSFNIHTDIVKNVRFHPDPEKLQLFSSSDDKTIGVYDLRDSECVAIFREHVGLPTQFAWTPDGYILASCGRDKVLNFYELREFKHIKTIPIMEELESVVIFDDATTKQLLKASSNLIQSKKNQQYVLATGGNKGIVKFFVLEIKGKDEQSFSCTPWFTLPLSPVDISYYSSADIQILKGIISISLTNETNDLIAVTNDYNINRFSVDIMLQKITSMGTQKPGFVDDLFVRPKETLIGSHGEILDLIRVPHSTTEDINNDKELIKCQLALVTNSPQLRILNPQLHCISLDGHKDIILSVDMSPDGQWIITSSKDKTIRVWSLTSYDCVALGEGHTEAVGAVNISHNPATYASRKAFAVSGAGDKILKRWNLPVHTFSNKLQQKLLTSHNIRAHDKDINSVAISPNDAVIASASQDKTVRLWNSDDLTPITTLHGHKRGVWKVLFSPVDKILVSCSGDRTIKLWSMVDYAIIRTLEGHTASVLNAKFVNLGTQIISCSADGLLRLWTIRSGECENTFDEHEDRVWAVETLDHEVTSTEESTENNGFDDQQREQYLYSAGSDSKIILWKDMTVEEDQQKILEAEKLILVEQDLYNHIRNKRYDQALTVALSLNMPNKVLSIIQDILEVDPNASLSEKNAQAIELGNLFKLDWSKRLDAVFLKMNDEQIKQLLNYVKEWNTNSRHCYLSQIILNSVLRLISYDRLYEWKEVKEMIIGLIAYSERHFQRIHKMSQASHYLDFVTSLINFMPIDTLELTKVENTQSQINLKRSQEDLENSQEPNDEAIAQPKDLQKPKKRRN